MYALNTFLRLFRFLTNTLLGIIIGFILGTLFAEGALSDVIMKFI